MFLTPSEVAGLTGYTKKSAQLRWLTAERFAFVVGGDGEPKVLRAAVTARLGGKESGTGSRREPVMRLA